MIFDGKQFAEEVEARVKTRVAKLERKPKIVSIMVGNDPASELYTVMKSRAAERTGIEFEIVRLENTEEMEGKINDAARSSDGVMIQLPIPGVTRERQNEILRCIPIVKDIDGLRWSESSIMPATVKAVVSILQKVSNSINEDLSKKKVVVVGSRGSVGKPLVYFLRENGYEDILEVNSETKDIEKIVRVGEIIISCVGKPGLITKEMIKSESIVVDVGISKVNGRVVGDMERDVYEKARVAVPTPGGVGPVTIASLMENVLVM